MNTLHNIDLVLFDTSAVDKTVVYLAYSTDEPAHPVWGGGVKMKDFPPNLPTEQIYRQLFAGSGVEYIHWPDAPAPVLAWLTQQPGRNHSPDWRRFDRTGPEHRALVLRAIHEGQPRPMSSRDNQVEVELPLEPGGPLGPGAPTAVVVFGRHDVLAPWVALEVRQNNV